MYSLAKTMRFSLEAPWENLPETVRRSILEGLDGKKIVMSVPPEAKVKREDSEGKEVGFGGIARRIERHYRRGIAGKRPQRESIDLKEGQGSHAEMIFCPASASPRGSG